MRDSWTAAIRILMLVIVALVASRQRASAETPTAPFVAGFDRFARHGDIPPATAGRLLLSELSCTACHATGEEALQPKRGPKLDGVAERLHPQWIKQFLAAPQQAKPGTTMPDVLAGLPEEEKQHAIDALAAYLSTQHKAFPELKAGGGNPVPFEFWNKGNAEQGEQLYHQVGCVACHQPAADYEVAEIKPSPVDELLEQLDADELAELGLAAAARRVESVPHGDLPAKYSRRSLTFFLLDPASMRPGGRMPSLKLQPVEAADIAAYLLKGQDASPFEEPPLANADLVVAGRKLFRELRCANCHDTNEKMEPRPAKPLASLSWSTSQSCFGQAHEGLPHYPLDEEPIAAVKAAATALEASTDQSPPDELHFRMLQSNCYACHERDKQGGVGRFRKPYFETVGHVDLGDEGRLPPPLTGVGRKLQPGWLKKVLDGKGDVRPHMHIRMPQFPPSAMKALPKLLAQADNADPGSAKEVFGAFGNLADAGRALMDVGCVQCHQFRGETLPGTVGVDLAGITQRVDPRWFYEFLMNPGELKQRTRMPTFFPGGTSQNKELLDGDPQRQIAAMWAYLDRLDKLPLPEKITAARAESYELIPRDRPVILRTFMEQAGTHAIAVGFPQKIHFAFDAETVRPAVAWRGGFLDALGTWFVRFAPPAEPLGEAAIEFPPGSPLATLKSESQPWPTAKNGDDGYRFAGYRLDQGGIPTFLYRYGPFDVQDRIHANEKNELTRRLTITPRDSEQSPPPLWFRANVGKQLEQRGMSAYQNDQGLTVTMPEEIAAAGKVRTMKETSEWIVPVDASGKTTIEVNYSW